VEIIEVDDIDAEALAARIEGLTELRWTPVGTVPSLVVRD
jgi:hypothetical protein